MEIEVGEYIRTNKGNIGKIIGIFNGHCTAKYHVEFQGNVKVKRQYLSTKTIVKYSKNIINLIEYRDLIKFKNPIKVSTIKSDKEKEIKFLDAYFCDGFMDYEGNKDTFMLYDLDYVINTKNIKNEDINYILTYEQINQNCYRLEE